MRCCFCCCFCCCNCFCWSYKTIFKVCLKSSLEQLMSLCGEWWVGGVKSFPCQTQLFSLKQNFLKHHDNTLKLDHGSLETSFSTPLKHPWNIIEHPWNLPQTTLKHVQNNLHISRKQSSNFLETIFKHFLNTNTL